MKLKSLKKGDIAEEFEKKIERILKNIEEEGWLFEDVTEKTLKLMQGKNGTKSDKEGCECQ